MSYLLKAASWIFASCSVSWALSPFKVTLYFSSPFIFLTTISKYLSWEVDEPLAVGVSLAFNTIWLLVVLNVALNAKSWLGP